MENRSSKEVAERLEEARKIEPKTSAGLWAQQDAVNKLEGDLMITHQAEIRQLGEQEVKKFHQLSGTY